MVKQLDSVVSELKDAGAALGDAYRQREAILGHLARLEALLTPLAPEPPEEPPPNATVV